MKIALKTGGVLVIACALMFPGCHSKEKSKHPKQKEQIVVAQSKASVQRLYFTGTLAPITTVAVVSPVAGNISELYFTYGEHIKEKEKLLVIESKPLSDDYRKAVTDFLQKKQAFATGKTSFEGTQALYTAGVVARNEFTTQKTQYENASLDFLQAQYALERVLRTANIDPKQIEALSLAQTKEVNEILQRHFKHIEITAPGDGVALFPIGGSSGDSSGDSSSSSSGKIIVGAEVKEGQLLLSIGDLSGLSANFDVSEENIDRIHENMPVIITGSAFAGAELKGFISAVSAQASPSSGGGGGLSMYSVSIKIPTVDPIVMKKIRVGMNAKFEVDIKSPPHVMLPVNAVIENNGMTTATILDSQGKQKTVPVVTGNTTPTEVVIVSGVNPGDKVVVP